jgi:prepilin-type N-terminal cleavage/methylation domain-containing protein
MEKHPSSDIGGFSLIEVLIVIAVIGVLSAFAILQIGNALPAYRANAAMDQVVAQLRMARQTAIADRRNVRVIFNAPNGIQTRRLEIGGAVTPLTSVVFEGYVVFTLLGHPDTPDAFGNGAPIVFGGIGGGPGVMAFTSTGAFIDGATGDPINGTIFLGLVNQPMTARAVSVLGATGRVRPYRWINNGWVQ